MKRILFAGAAMFATAGSIALAQPAPPNAGRMVSVEEMRQRSAERFSAMDSNKDGQLTRDELRSGRRGPQAGRPGRLGRWGGGPVRGADANNDGIVTRQEFTARAMERFQRLDADRDGRITAEEARGRRGQRAQRGGPGGARGFAMLDADRNGAVSRAEFDRGFAERIARLDGDRDGTITPEERRAGRMRPAPRQ